MLTLEDPECKDYSKNAMEDEEANEKGNSGENYGNTKFPTVNGEILRTVLLSAGDDNNEEDDDDDDEEEENDEDENIRTRVPVDPPRLSFSHRFCSTRRSHTRS